VDIDNKYIKGSNLFRFTATEDFDTLQFDLFDNLSVDKVVYKGRDLPFHREYNAVFVAFPRIIEKGKLDSFVVHYSGHPIQATRAPWDGGFDWKTDSNGKPFVATACQGLGASVWWPNKDHQSDEVDSMLISVSVPRGLTNVSNGRLVNQVQLENGYDRFDWKVVNPINNYNVAINIGDYIHFGESYAGEKGPLDIDYYILRENDIPAKREHLRHHVLQTVEALEHWYGPYPFYEDGYKIVETAHLGMEHQSSIAYGNKYLNGYLGNDRSGTGWGMKLDFIITHESGHEWFGNNITAADPADMWIQEAFTNYSEALVIEYFYGKEAGQIYLNGNRFTIQNDYPIQGPYDVNDTGSSDMYNKGGVMLNILRTILQDDEKWRSILRGLNQKFYHKQVDYHDIVNYINAATQHDFSKFFQQYVQYSSLPILDIKFGKNGQVFARWVSEVPDFDMPVHIGKSICSILRTVTKTSILKS
jgi:aminopeptidase N